MNFISHITLCLAGTSECKQIHHQQTARITEYKNTPTYLGYIPHLQGVYLQTHVQRSCTACQLEMVRYRSICYSNINVHCYLKTC